MIGDTNAAADQVRSLRDCVRLAILRRRALHIGSLLLDFTANTLDNPAKCARVVKHELRIGQIKAVAFKILPLFAAILKGVNQGPLRAFGQTVRRPPDLRADKPLGLR